MKVAGIVAEYDPFHKGHLYHIEETKRRCQVDCLVAVMSGSFTQRGEPAFFDKWLRAEMAIRNGIDLVIELPFYYACNHAEVFSEGAIGILDSLGQVDILSFGSESGDIDSLKELAKSIYNETDEFKAELKKSLEMGASYAKAKASASLNIKNSELLKSPNNLLGIEYLISLEKIKSDMTPFTVKRLGEHDKLHDYDDDDDADYDGFKSAKYIREQIKNRDEVRHDLPKSTNSVINRKKIQNRGEISHYLPENTNLVINREKNYKNIVLDDFYEILAANLLLGDKIEDREGLYNRVYNALDMSKSMEDLINLTKTRRYTRASIKRLICYIITNSEYISEPLYARILGFSNTGRKLLRKINKEESNKIPIVTNVNKIENEMLDFEIRVSDLCEIMRKGHIGKGSDHRRKPFMKNAEKSRL